MHKIEALRNYMEQEKIDGVLITSLENMQWYSGFSGDTGQTLVTDAQEYFITDFRYMEMAENELGDRFTYIKARTDGAVKEVTHLLGKGGYPTLAIEKDVVTLTQMHSFETTWFFNYVAIDAELKRLRTIKTAEEIATMREGAKIVEDIFMHLTSIIQIGMTEFDILAEMQYQMSKKGCTPSFTPIIASGPNSSLPHASVSDRKLQAGDLLTMDFGVRYKGLCTDFTRTVSLGEVEEELAAIYDIVKEANEKAYAGIAAGKKANEIDAIARAHISAAGYGAYYEHGTGHGVGVEIHEAPWISANSENVLVPGMVFTIEPGIYLPGKGGVRIEDMVVLTKTGVENFYTVTKERIIL
ncbi:MAG: M24 family metallopeptidase [Christensenellaceae bacterium]|jgi:Xaa-Pro aminopeptidase